MANKKGRTKCEVWSRVVGYLRPTARWNDGKLAEFVDRILFKKDDDKDEAKEKDEDDKKC